jgi:hypothetical protein
MSTPGDDAQRKLEQHALRNVRALVDKIETTEELDRKALRRHVAVIVGVILGLFVIAFAVWKLAVKQEPPRTLVLPPPQSAPK